MAMGAGMTSAIMNPVALPVTTKKIEEKHEQIKNAGIAIAFGFRSRDVCQNIWARIY